MARGWWTTIGVTLCAGLLPGCALFGDRPASDGKGVVNPRGRGLRGDDRGADAFVKPYVEPPPPQDPLAIFTPFQLPDHAVSEPGLLPDAGPTQATVRKPGAPPGPAADLAAGTAAPAPEHPTPLPGPTVVFGTAPAPAPKAEPLLEALECFLKDQPEKALELLKGYQPSSQEVYISLLPVLAQLTHKGVDQLTPEEVSAIHEQLHSLAAELRPRARLVIDRMCFCERIQGYGLYRSLPEGHAFRARGGDQPGELVQLYVELRNFALAACPQGYLTRLASSVEICDGAGKQQWFHNFKDQEGPLYRQAPWQDCFGNYRFYVPPIPPGSYTLTITIRDVTHPETPRVARKSLALQVG